jgi:hypothetical protein
MACSKFDSAVGSLPIPDWSPPGKVGTTVRRFSSTFEKFGYNNFSASDLREHTALMSKTQGMMFLEIVFPFGTFTASIRQCDVVNGLPLEANIFKTDKDAQLFLVKSAMFERVARLSAGDLRVLEGSVHAYRCTFTEDFAGEQWDKRCLGIAVTFGERVACVNGRFFSGGGGELLSRPPLCSYMTRNRSKEKTTNKKLGSYDRTGLPISAFVTETRMFFALGIYCGVGFGNDLLGCSEFIDLVDTIHDRRGKAWADAVTYASCFDSSAPLSGDLCNTGSIAYVAGVSFRDDDVDQLLLIGAWGSLLKTIALFSGVRLVREGSGRCYIRADDFDNLYEMGPFLLVSCLEYITSAIAGEVFQEVLLPDGTNIKVDNDLGLYRRNHLVVRRR